MATTVQCTDCPLGGVWMPQSHVKHLFYGAGCVEKHLLSILPPSRTPASVFIVTGTSIATKTGLISQLEQLLGPLHAGTFAGIRQHGPAEGVDEATELVKSQLETINTVISVGGGSPIDSAKTVVLRIHEATAVAAVVAATTTTTAATTTAETAVPTTATISSSSSSLSKSLLHIAIPTTLSAAECTAGGGFTRADGTKVGFMHPVMGVGAIFYDAGFARHTPLRLWLSTGMRAVDHAVEAMYHPQASEMPWKALAQWAFAALIDGLPQSRGVHGVDSGAADHVTTMLQLAAFASAGLRGANFRGGMGLSHALGHVLGSSYGIPHGETSCLTLAPVIRHKAATNPAAARQIARLLPGAVRTSKLGSSAQDAQSDAIQVAQCVEALVNELGLTQPSLSERGVGRAQVDVIAGKVSGGNGAESSLVALVEALF